MIIFFETLATILLFQKPQNILLVKGGNVKLCDFGFARKLFKSAYFN